MTTLTQRSSGRKRRTSSAASEGAAPDGLRAQGVRTRNTIIRVATKLLLQGGNLEFSLRAVADGAGISISNLQYYFPTRLAVLRAVMEPTLVAYEEILRHALDNSSSPQEAIDFLLERAVSDAKDAKTTTLWWHFVSLASNDPECARLLDEWYDMWTDGVAQLVRAKNPKCTVADSMDIATLVIALTDGLGVRLGAGRHKRINTRGLDAKFLALANHLLRGELPGTGSR